jgi:hypothetical protein
MTPATVTQPDNYSFRKSEYTAIIGAASASSSPPSTPPLAPPTDYKPVTEFIIAVSVGGAVFISVIALVILVFVRKRRNRVLRKEAVPKPEAVKV